MSYDAQDTCDKMNILARVKNYAEYSYNDLHTLPRMVYSTRNKQRNGKKSNSKENLRGDLQ